MEKKIVFITGAANGIGKAVAEKYSQDDCIVIAADNVYEHNGKFKESELFPNTYCIGLDVGEDKEVADVINKIENQFGTIDILLHVAGVFKLASVENTTVEDWNRIYRTNTFGVFNVVGMVVEKMKKKGSGSVVVVSSNASKYPRMGMAAYASSKAATSMFVKCLALEVAQYGIRCNIVSPGSTNTNMQKQIWNGATTVPPSVLEGDLSSYRLGIPLNKIAEPNEVADVIYFLASERAGHITMEEVTVDGGATMGV